MTSGVLSVVGATKPYHPDMTIDGVPMSFAHLDPRALAFHVRNLDRVLVVDVKFSNHCFSEAFIAGTHDRSWLVMDGTRERAFCWERYELSRKLPEMVSALPEAAVWVTTSERNYVSYIMRGEGAEAYPMFFHLRKKGGHGEDLTLFVESAYPMGQGDLKTLAGASQKVRFPVLCAKIFQGQAVRFNARR